jgi:uncharacterized membrane protein
MTHRMAIAALSVIGFFISLYLWLWKVGFLGSLACGDGGCETVQLSDYADFLGVPVPFWGMVGYVALLGLSLVGLQPRWVERREPTFLLALVSGVGVGFAGYLSYLEAAVIHAWCRWCIASAVIIALIFVMALAGMRATSRASQAG